MKFTRTEETRYITGDLKNAPEVTGRSGVQLQSISIDIEYTWGEWISRLVEEAAPEGWNA